MPILNKRGRLHFVSPQVQPETTHGRFAGDIYVLRVCNCQKAANQSWIELCISHIEDDLKQKIAVILRRWIREVAQFQDSN